MCPILSPQGKYIEAKLGSSRVFQPGKLGKGCVTFKCLKYHFSIHIFVAKRFVLYFGGVKREQDN